MGPTSTSRNVPYSLSTPQRSSAGVPPPSILVRNCIPTFSFVPGRSRGAGVLIPSPAGGSPGCGRQAGEITGHRGNIGIVQALGHRAHQFTGIVLSGALPEGVEGAGEVLGGLPGEIGGGMFDTHAVRTMAGVACRDAPRFIALVRQLMTARQGHGVERRGL